MNTELKTMQAIKPFKGIYYNKEKIGDFSEVVCPPYDVISQEQQTAFYARNPYNFIRLSLAKDQEGDTETDNKYTRAQANFQAWLEKEILLRDEKPCLYFYKQDYRILGQRYSRLGFISLMKLQEDEVSKVFPHENTHSKAKEDRLKLWHALGGNESGIFVCFSDERKTVEKIFSQEFALSKPFIEATDKDGVRHRIWRLEKEELIQQVDQALSNQNLFIADGHHRYEVARQLRREILAGQNHVTGEEPCNYVMTYFTNMDAKNLQIFPMHRILKVLPKDLDFLSDVFRIDKVKTKEDLVILLARAGLNEHAFGLYTKDGIKLLRLKNKLLIDEYVKEGSAEYKQLDATILKAFILDRVGVKSTDIVYTNDMEEATTMVDTARAPASFIMNPVKIEQLRSIALNGERMPPKTTYFYPKVLSGLLVYKMD